MTRIADTTQVVDMIDRYISIWNETNPERRQALIAATLTEDGTYRAPYMSSDNHAGFAALMDSVQLMLPGHTLRLTTGVDVVANMVRFGWSAVNDATGATAVAGIDVGEFGQDGRLCRITGFHDEDSGPAEGM